MEKNDHCSYFSDTASKVRTVDPYSFMDKNKNV